MDWLIARPIGRFRQSNVRSRQEDMQTPNGQGRAGFTLPMAEPNATDNVTRRAGFIPPLVVWLVGSFAFFKRALAGRIASSSCQQFDVLGPRYFL